MPTTDSTIVVDCVTDESKFFQLRDEWNYLAQQTIPNSVFLRHEWFDAAWQWLKADSLLQLLCVYRGENLIGICPLISRVQKQGFFMVRTFEFLSVPDTQLAEILSTPSDHADVIAAVAKQLYDMRADWDNLEFTKLRSNSETLTRLPAAMKPYKLRAVVKPNGTNPFIELEDSWEKYYARRSRRLKKGNNLVANRIKRAHPKNQFHHIHNPVTDMELTQNLNACIDISSKSWKKETGLTLDNPGPGAFIRTLTQHAHEQNWLSIWMLSLDGSPIAMEYQLTYNGDVHALRADFDTTFNELSPGTYLNWEIIKQSVQSDMTRYYFGPGDNQYKLRWAEHFEQLHMIIAFSYNLRGRLLALLALDLRPLAKRALNLFGNKFSENTGKTT